MKYFAYGSNMSIKRLQARVPSARSFGTFCLRGYVLRFHKVSRDGSAKCDVYSTGDEQDKVFGVVFDINAEEKPALDRVEGLGQGYDIERVELVDAEGVSLSAFTYCATNKRSGLLPYCWYRHHVLVGARQAGLSTDYISAIESVACVADPDQRRADLEASIYQ